MKRCHTYISTIYPLNGKSKNWALVYLCFTFTFTFSNGVKKCLLVFTFYLKKFTFRFTFRNSKKKLKVQNILCILQASYSHTRAIIGIFSKFRFFEKSRYFRQKPFLKKSKLLKIALGRCCVFFVYPDSTRLYQDEFL